MNDFYEHNIELLERMAEIAQHWRDAAAADAESVGFEYMRLVANRALSDPIHWLFGRLGDDYKYNYKDLGEDPGIRGLGYGDRERLVEKFTDLRRELHDTHEPDEVLPIVDKALALLAKEIKRNRNTIAKREADARLAAKREAEMVEAWHRDPWGAVADRFRRSYDRCQELADPGCREKDRASLFSTHAILALDVWPIPSDVFEAVGHEIAAWASDADDRVNRAHRAAEFGTKEWYAAIMGALDESMRSLNEHCAAVV